MLDRETRCRQSAVIQPLPLGFKWLFWAYNKIWRISIGRCKRTTGRFVYYLSQSCFCLSWSTRQQAISIHIVFFFLQHCCPPAKWLLKNQRMYLWSWKNQLNNLIRAMFHKLHTQLIFQISHKPFYWINYFMLNWKYFNFIWWPLNRWPFDVEQLVMYFIRRAWLVCKVKDSGFTAEVIF